MRYKLSEKVNLSPADDGGLIVLNSNDSEYYHMDELVKDFIDYVVRGFDIERYCENIANQSNVGVEIVQKDYTELLASLVELKILVEV